MYLSRSPEAQCLLLHHFSASEDRKKKESREKSGYLPFHDRDEVLRGLGALASSDFLEILDTFKISL